MLPSLFSLGLRHATWLVICNRFRIASPAMRSIACFLAATTRRRSNASSLPPSAGAPYDQIARQYMADALSGNTTAGYGPGAGLNVTRADVRRNLLGPTLTPPIWHMVPPGPIVGPYMPKLAGSNPVYDRPRHHIKQGFVLSQGVQSAPQLPCHDCRCSWCLRRKRSV